MDGQGEGHAGRNGVSGMRGCTDGRRVRDRGGFEGDVKREHGMESTDFGFSIFHRDSWGCSDDHGRDGDDEAAGPPKVTGVISYGRTGIEKRSNSSPLGSTATKSARFGSSATTKTWLR